MSDEKHPILLPRQGESPQSVARELSRHSSLSFDESLEMLCANNQISPQLRHCGGRPLWIQPERLEQQACPVWQEDQRVIGQAFLSAPNASRVAQQDPWLLSRMDDFIGYAEQNKWMIGDKVAQLAGFGATGVSAYSGVLHGDLRGIAQLADRVYSDVMTRFSSSRSPFGVSKAERGVLEKLLQSHPSYAQLRKALDGLPRFVQRSLGNIHLPRSPVPNADFFRRQFVVPKGVRPGTYLQSVTHRLGDQVLRAGRYARNATWVVPAVLGVYATATAPEGKKLRTAAGEAVGVVFGAGGSLLGGAAVTGAVATGLVVLPGGVVFVAAVVAAAVVGYGMYTLGKGIGESWYDTISDTVAGWADAWVEIF